MAAIGGRVAEESWGVKEGDPPDPPLTITAQSKAEQKRDRRMDRRTDTSWITQGQVGYRPVEDQCVRPSVCLSCFYSAFGWAAIARGGPSGAWQLTGATRPPAPPLGASATKGAAAYCRHAASQPALGAPAARIATAVCYRAATWPLAAAVRGVSDLSPPPTLNAGRSRSFTRQFLPPRGRLWPP